MKNTSKKWRALLICALLAALCGAALLSDGNLRSQIRECIACPEFPQNPRIGKWYGLSPKGAFSADGSAWRGKIRFGSENKLMIYLLGGGVVLDDFSAGQSYAEVGSAAFYYDNDLGVSHARLQGGITSSSEENPFRDWTILVLPYTTGDFHIGAGETIVRHNGYNNYSSLMEMVRSRLGTPEALLIAGYSAGGFGAAMLAENILDYFPDTAHVTLCVDSALLLSDQWLEIAAKRWHAPEEITSRIATDNLTMDHLRALNRSHPEVKILFTSSAYDGGLAKFQSYLDGGAYASTDAAAEIYFSNLKAMAAELQDAIPGAGLYIWDGIPYAANPNLTRHTILYSDSVFAPLQDDISIAEWIFAAVEGKIESHGLQILS